MEIYAGIDLGGTFIKGGLVTADGTILAKDKVPTGASKPYSGVLDRILSLISSLRASLPEEYAQCPAGGIGIGSPGIIRSKDGVVAFSSNLGWNDVPLRDEMEKLSGLPVAVSNDANAAALGEYFFGSSRGFSSSVLITLGTGIGSGIILGGRLFEGCMSAGGEAGHSVIRAGGRKCSCGRRGCFEQYASASALSRDTREAMKRHRGSLMWDICGSLLSADGRTAFEAAERGDPAAAKVVRNYINFLAEGVTNLANEFRPEIILIGGGLSGEGERLLAPLRTEVEKRLLIGTAYAPLRIEAASLGNDAGLCGAACLAIARSRSAA